jgi:hypothetical protein
MKLLSRLLSVTRGGAAGTRFWGYPREQMIGIFMIQILPHTNLTYGTQFKQLAYQAIAD